MVQAVAPKPTSYKVYIDGDWSLEDLYVFPRTYEQVYFAVYSLFFEHADIDFARISRAYEGFPWQGGYSAVNFYNQLKHVVRKRDRPAIVSLKYSSPGWIELSLALSVAYAVGKIVKSFCGSIQQCNDTYGLIMKGMHERKLLRLEESRAQLAFDKKELDFIISSSKKLSKIIDVTDIGEIESITGHPYRSLKIQLSLFRRIRTLANYQKTGKADLPDK